MVHTLMHRLARRRARTTVVGDDDHGRQQFLEAVEY